MLSIRSMLADMSKAFGSSAFQLAITLISAPIMTRLYTPDDYGVFGTFNTVVAVIVGVGTMSLGPTYAVGKTLRSRLEILRVLVTIIFGLCAASLLMALGYIVWSHGQSAPIFPWYVALLLPLAVFTSAINGMMTYISVHRRKFNVTAMARMVEPVVARGGAIGAGALGGSNAAYVILAACAGFAASAFTQKHVLMRHSKRYWAIVFPLRFPFASVWKKYSDIMVFNTMSGQLHTVAVLVLQMSIVAYVSKAMAGHYILATSITALPCMLAALATAPIVYRYLIDIEKTHPSMLLDRVLRIMVAYFALAMISYAPLLFFGEELFVLVFGSKWAAAGFIAAMIAVPDAMRFTFIGMESVYRVTGTTKFKLKLDLFAFAIMLPASIYCLQTMDFFIALLYIALGWILLFALGLAGCVVAVRQYMAQVETEQKVRA